MPDPIEIPPVNPPEPPNLPDDGDEKEKIDPGSLEGLPKAEPTDSHNVQKRIDKLTKKFRDEERARLDLEKKLADIDAAHQRDMEIARQHNDQLIAAMKTAQAPKEKPPENDIEAMTKEIERLEAAEDEALDNLDLKAAKNVQKQIAKLKDRIYDVKLALAEKKVREETTSQTAKSEIDLAVAQFARETKWFRRPNAKSPNPDYDPLMAGAAVELEAYLSSQREWREKPYAELLAEVKSRVEEKFAYGRQKAKPPTVAGVGSPPPNGSPASNLSDEEKRVARRMFPDMKPQDAEKIWLDQKTGRV